jgi:hypothetical protein
VATLIDRIRRRRWARLVCVLVMAGLVIPAIGCSNQAAEQAAADSPLGIKVAQSFMTIQNKSGTPLTDVTIAIVPVGRQTEYRKFYGRIETSQNLDVSVGEFRGADGTPFSLRVVKPRSIKIKASTMAGKKYDVELPWN